MSLHVTLTQTHPVSNSAPNGLTRERYKKEPSFVRVNASYVFLVK